LNLEELGWDAFFADAFEPYAADNLIPARVSARHHGPCELLTELGRMGGLPAGKLTDEELPAVGDWIALNYAAVSRDPATTEDPTTLNIHRKGVVHSAFGMGPHRCLGSHLARLELNLAA